MIEAGPFTSDVIPNDGLGVGCWVAGWYDENRNDIDPLVTIHHADPINATRVVALLAGFMEHGRVMAVGRVSGCDHAMKMLHGAHLIAALNPHTAPEPVHAEPPAPGAVLVRVIVPRGHEFNSYAPAQAIHETREMGDRVLEVRMMPPKRYCGGDHCAQLWNLPCDAPEHRRHVYPPQTHPEGK